MRGIGSFCSVLARSPIRASTTRVDGGSNSGRPALRKYATGPNPDEYNDAVEGDFNLILHPEDRIKGTKHFTHRGVPPEIRRPGYAVAGVIAHTGTPSAEALYQLGSEEEKDLRAAGKLASSAREYISGFVKPGVTPDELDQLLHKWIIEHDCYPSTLGYQGFPRSCCVSVNNIVAHAIPDRRPLEETDMLTLDLTLYTRAGYHSDTSKTFCSPPFTNDSFALDLEEVTRFALYSAIAACGPGVPFREIGRIIERTVDAESSGNMSVVKQLTGHGVGREFHMKPWIMHYENDEPGKMKPGHCFTIEPAVIASRDSSIFTWLDEWTISTVNGARAAQMEHTVLITEDGVDILTR